MLNEDKIELMTGIAMFEKREGKQIAAAGKMFKSDFVGRHMLHAFLRFTAAYVLLFGDWEVRRASGTEPDWPCICSSPGLFMPGGTTRRTGPCGPIWQSSAA